MKVRNFSSLISHMKTEEPVFVLCGPLPPPMTGMASVNSSVVDRLAPRTPIIINMSRDFADISLKSYISKILRTLLGCLQILRLTAAQRKSFYSSVDDGLGGFLTSLLTLSARVRKCRIILHHHSYRYLSKPSWQMCLLVRIAGTHATHVFLCEQMADEFRMIYRRPFHSLICPNPVSDQKLVDHFSRLWKPRRHSVFTVGFISNLTFSKGVREFVETVRQAVAFGINLRAVMAGAAVNTEVQNYLAAAQKDLGQRLELLGAVRDERKIAFFESIDVLLFPSHGEAFPLVLLEGLLAGCPITTYGHGCIPRLGELETAWVLPSTVDFPRAAIAILSDIIESKHSLIDLKWRAHEEGLALHAANVAAHELLIHTIIAGERT